MVQASFPITELENLKYTESCFDENSDVTPAQKLQISDSLFKCLDSKFPQTNPVLQDILALYRSDRDGYGALYSLVFRCTDLLDHFRKFAPAWDSKVRPSTYVAQLLTLQKSEKLKGTSYTDVELSVEMLRHAIESGGSRSMLATTIKAELDTWLSQNNPADLHQKHTVRGLADRFAKQPKQTDSFSKAQINFVGETAKGKSNKDQKDRRRYRPGRRNFQCQSCEQIGHNLTNGDKGEICRFTAHFIHASKFIREHSQEAKINAQTYWDANTPNLVNMVAKHFDDNDSDHDDEIEASLYQISQQIEKGRDEN